MEKDYDAMVAEAIVDTFYVPNPTFYRNDVVCIFNSSVDCEAKKCRFCGWNPKSEVIPRRIARAKRMLQQR